MIPICGVYLITHRETGRGYVGLSTNIQLRWRAHRCPSSGQRISTAIKKFGRDAFTFDVLEECPTTKLGDREIHWIEQLETWGPKGFNMNPGGSYPASTPESRRKISDALRGVPKTAEHRQKVIDALTGRELSDELKAKFSEAAKRRWQDPEKRAALMASRSKRRVFSEEVKAKMSVSASKHLLKPEARKQRADAMTLRMSDPAEREKVKLSMRMRMSDPSARAVVSASVKAYWANKRKETYI